MSVVWLVASAWARKEPSEPAAPVRPEVSRTVVTAAVEPGSLWQEVQARRLMGLDAGARQAGDLVTVLITEQTATSIDAATGTSRASEAAAGVAALLGAEKRILKAHPDMGEAIALGAGSSSAFTGEGGTRRGSSVQTVLTCEVIEVTSNGNLRIWGYKKVRVNRETQFVVLTGVVRPRDIRMDNTVASDFLSEAQLEITGNGVLADKQGPGFLTRVLDHVWPF